MPTDEQLRDIRWALEELSAKRERYLLYQRYFSGDHALMIDERRLRTIFGRLFGRFRLNAGAVRVPEARTLGPFPGRLGYR